MKKHIVTFLICFVIAGAFAQNYSQTFDGGFQHVDLSHTSTGLFYEPGILSECTHQHSSLVKQTHSSDTDKADSVNSHSIGINVGWLNGVSLKFHLKKNVYLQTDLGVTLLVVEIPVTFDVGGRFFVLYENLFPRRTNTYWIAGGGIGLGAIPHSDGKKEASLKGCVQSLFGIEFKPSGTHLSFQFDTRLGYGIIYSTKGVDPRGRFGLVSYDNPLHFFDFAFVASIRYHFGKKN
jgi:hypothetical protein